MRYGNSSGTYSSASIETVGPLALGVHQNNIQAAEKSLEIAPDPKLQVSGRNYHNAKMPHRLGTVLFGIPHPYPNLVDAVISPTYIIAALNPLYNPSRLAPISQPLTPFPC